MSSLGPLLEFGKRRTAGGPFLRAQIVVVVPNLASPISGDRILCVLDSPVALRDRSDLGFRGLVDGYPFRVLVIHVHAPEIDPRGCAFGKRLIDLCPQITLFARRVAGSRRSRKPLLNPDRPRVLLPEKGCDLRGGFTSKIQNLVRGGRDVESPEGCPAKSGIIQICLSGLDGLGKATPL